MEPVSLAVARASYRSISLYAPDRTPCAVDLSDNTNLWGVPPAAQRAIREVAAKDAARYPEVYASRLKGALSRYLGVPTEMLVTGCGSDDVLDSAIRAFAELGDRIVFPDPTFAMVPIFARMNGLEGVAVPLSHDYDADAEAMIGARASVTYLCSPNNPTGTVLPRRTVEQIVHGADGVVIIDEAYAEYAGETFLDFARREDRVLVVRTLSKAFGLAGLRVGYGVGAPALVAEVEKSRGPYKVNTLAERAAIAALDVDRPWVEEKVAEARRQRDRLVTALGTLGLDPLPSAANFVLVPIRNAAAVGARMRSLGVAVRPFGSLPLVSPALRATNGDALRISVGPSDAVDLMLAALREALGQCA